MPRFKHQSGEFKSLVSEEWFERPDESSVWLRLYSSLVTSPEALSETVREWAESDEGFDRLLSFAGEVMFGAGTIRDLNVVLPRTNLFTDTAGVVRLELHPELHPLPPGGYVFLAVPYRVDGAPGDEPKARRILDSVAGLLCIHAGRSFMWECVAEGEVEGKEGKFAMPSAARKMPQPPDGPFLGVQIGVDIAQISEAVRQCGEPRRSRFELALRLADEAMRKDQGFFEYCTALEVACDGTGGKIKRRLAEAYDFKNHAEAARNLGLDVLTRWRGDYVHKGKAPVLSSDVERFIQLLFLDLLRHELGLPLSSHARAFQKAVGIDLSPLGLSDNRTEAQRRAMDPSMPPKTALEPPSIEHRENSA